jgi:hypothetical protein
VKGTMQVGLIVTNTNSRHLKIKMKVLKRKFNLNVNPFVSPCAGHFATDGQPVNSS